MSLTDFSEPQPSLAWTFDGTTAPYTGSLSATNISGTNSYTSGKSNQAISFFNPFASVSNSITYTLTSTINMDSGFTMAVWVKFSNSPGGGGTDACAVEIPTVGAVNGGRLRFAGGSSVLAYNSTFYSVGGSMPAYDTWVHYTATILNGIHTFYTNGVLTGTASYPTNGTMITDTVYAGRSSYYGMDGLVDDLRIYNTALTAAQIQSIYTQGGAPASNFRVMPQPNLAWDFNGTTTDYVSGTTGATTGSVSYNSIGKYGQSLVITNTAGLVASNYVNYNTPYYPSTLTTAVWIKLNTIGIGNQYFIQFGGTSGGISYVIYINSNNTVAFRVQALGEVATTISTVSTVTAGQWYHIAAVIDGYNQTIYLNGVIAAGPSPCDTLAFQYRNITLGGSTTNAGRVLVNGELDDLRIFDKALTSSQVQSIYNQQGMPGRAVQNGDGLILYTPFNGTTTDSINSVVPTLTGSVSYDTVNAKYTQSLIVTNTPGANATNYLQYGKTIDIAVTGLTCAFWVRTGTDVTTAQTMVSFRGQAQYQGQIRYDLFSGRFAMTYWNGKSGGGASSASAYNAGPVLSTNTWYHLAIAIKPNGSISFYVNGVEYAAGQNCGLRDIGPTNSRVDSFFVGTSAINPNYQNAFSGEFDDLRLYKYGLETPAIVSLYNTTGPANFSPPSTTLTGAPLFNQLSPSATSSAVGAFSLRAVNGVSTRAVNVAPGGTFPPSAMTQTGTNSSTQTLGTGGKFQGSYIASSSTSAYGWGAPGAFALNNSGNQYIWQVGNYPVGGGSLSTPTTTTAGATNYNGEWLQFQTPFPINLTGYSAGTGFLTSVVLLASTTGATSSWILVDSKSAITVGSTITSTGLNFAGYSYFRFVVITSTINYPLLYNVKFFGTVPSLAQDFYADERGNLLTAPVVGTTLQNWLGGATGYVTKWYDQSGTNHAIQDTAANQPIIQRATKGPGYMVNFNGTSQFVTLSADSQFLNGTNITVNAVALRTATKTTQNWFFGTNTPSVNYQRFQFGFQSDTIISMNVTSGPTDVTIPAYNASNEPVYYMTGGLIPSRVFYQNDTLGGTNVNGGLMSAPTGYSYSIGNGNQGGVYYYKGNLFELLLFTSALDQTQVTQIYQNQLGVYGT